MLIFKCREHIWMTTMDLTLEMVKFMLKLERLILKTQKVGDEKTAT